MSRLDIISKEYKEEYIGFEIVSVNIDTYPEFILGYIEINYGHPKIILKKLTDEW